jgi:exopolysaccharide production protein ExoQ
MNPSLALLIFTIVIAGLFFLDRDPSARPSSAMWLPVIWLWICGSRSISSWLDSSPVADSPIDELLAGILVFLGIIVLVRRRNVGRLIRLVWPVVLYFSYCLVSVLWSDFPEQGFKRWAKALGDLVMVMIIATDAKPMVALGRFFSRVGFVLLPTSVLLIKSYPGLGRAYDTAGLMTNTGVTTNKNMLGVLAYVVALAALWQVLRLLGSNKLPNRNRHLLAQCTLLYFSISLLFSAHSATSGTCFTLGAVFMASITLPVFRRRPAAVHALVLAIVLGGGLTVLLGGKAAAAKVVGRNADFTGRTEVWDALVPAVPNPMIGAGFETFWFGPRLENLQIALPGINEAHDGYLEVYLNLGLVGVGLIALILIMGYRTAVRAFRRDPALGNLLIAYILTAAIYSITEAGFRMLDPIWFCQLMSTVIAAQVMVTGEQSSRVHAALAEPRMGVNATERWPNPISYELALPEPNRDKSR